MEKVLLEIQGTILEFGKATAFYLNGDDLSFADQLEGAISNLETCYKKDSQIKRLFIDEITAIEGWEKVIKKLWDQGHLRDNHHYRIKAGLPHDK